MDNHMDNNPNGNRPDNNKGPGRQDPNKNHQSILAFLVCLLVTLVCFAMFTNMPVSYTHLDVYKRQRNN